MHSMVGCHYLVDNGIVIGMVSISYAILPGLRYNVQGALGLLYRHFLSLTWWHHQMEIYFAFVALCEGNPPVTSRTGENYSINTLVDTLSAWWWRHQMETFSALLALCGGIHQWIRGALIFSLICAWTNGWANNRNSVDLRRHRPHYDVTVIIRPEHCASIDCIKHSRFTGTLS